MGLRTTLLIALGTACLSGVAASADEPFWDGAPTPSVIAAQFTRSASSDDALFGAVARVGAPEPAALPLSAPFAPPTP